MNDKIKEFTSLIAFWVIGLITLILIGYVIANINSITTISADEITTENECRKAGYAWHAVNGCTTQENFVDSYVDRN